MMGLDERNRQRLQNQPLWQSYPRLYEQVLATLVRHDPIGICDHEEGSTEYTAEVNTILPRLKEAATEDELMRLVREELIRWFDTTALRRDHAGAIGHELWSILQDAEFQAQIQTIPRDLPHLVVSAIANLLIHHQPIRPEEYEGIAHQLRIKAERFEQWAIGLRRREEQGKEPG